jgi:hypothetical protein
MKTFPAVQQSDYRARYPAAPASTTEALKMLFVRREVTYPRIKLARADNPVAA